MEFSYKEKRTNEELREATLLRNEAAQAADEETNSLERRSFDTFQRLFCSLLRCFLSFSLLTCSCTCSCSWKSAVEALALRIKLAREDHDLTSRHASTAAAEQQVGFFSFL